MNILRRAVRVALLAFLGVLTGATLLAAAVFHIAHSIVTPARRKFDVQILGVDVASQTIEISRTADTELPGRYALFTNGDYNFLKLGAVLSMTEFSVRRKLLTKVARGAELSPVAGFSSWYYSSPEELHLPFESVIIGGPQGPCPAWFFPGDSDLCVIQVHGRGVTRHECLRAVPVLNSAGHSVLLTSYRNDGEAARSRSGAYGLGSTEWHDIEAAIAFALRQGAKRIVLMGWSMGGAIVLQTLMSSAYRESICGVILESPVVDWRPVLDFHVKLAGYREPFPQLAMTALSSDLTARMSGAEGAIPFDSLDMVARAAEISVPILILHSDDDGFVPADASHALAEARPDIVTMPHFDVARHTKLWNYDEKSWTTAIADWLKSLDDH